MGKVPKQRRKVLMVTYYWPPAGGITVLRCLKIAKYLRQYGWEPVIYTASNAQYPYLDPANNADIPEGCTVLRQPIVEPLHAFKKLTGRSAADPLINIVHVRDRKQRFTDKLGIWIRANFFIPDARALWITPSVRFLTEYLKKNPVDALFSDGPPHTNTMIACRVKKATGIPWLADFQDPWTQADYYPLLGITGRAHRKHAAMEQDVFRTASKLCIASPAWKTELEAIGAQNVDVLYYGYDEDDFRTVQPKKNDAFTIIHTGLLGFDRSPDNVLQALKEICETVPGFRRHARLLLYGEVDYSITETINRLNLNELLTLGGTVDRRTVLEALCSAQVLLLPLNKAANAEGRMPGKFYEYLRAARPILALGPEHSDVGRVLDQTKAGSMVAYTDVGSAKRFIQNAYENWEKGKTAGKPLGIARFSNEKQTEQVARWLDEITQQDVSA